jgi:cold shock CspA family protein
MSSKATRRHVLANLAAMSAMPALATRATAGLADLTRASDWPVVRVNGTIKWFDVSKGYGFIVGDNDRCGDILLHATALRRDGYQTAYEGARIVCDAVFRGKGFQALRVRSVDNSTAVHLSLSRHARMSRWCRPAVTNWRSSSGSTGCGDSVS